MKVKELIEKLQQFSPEMTVVLAGYAFARYPVGDLKAETAVRSVYPPKEVEDTEPRLARKNDELIDVVVIRRQKGDRSLF